MNILSLVSSRFGRTEVMAIGKLSINLSQCPVNSSLPKVVYKLINQLVTKVTVCCSYSITPPYTSLSLHTCLSPSLSSLPFSESLSSINCV